MTRKNLNFTNKQVNVKNILLSRVAMLKKDSNCFKLVTRLLTSNLNALFQIRPAALKFVNDFSTNSQCQKQFSALRNYTAME